jgi:hypothetical protein
VYHLRGVRQRIAARVFPFVAYRLCVFFVLSCHRPGTYPGYIRVIDERTEKAVFFAHMALSPRFEDADETFATVIPLRCSFPQAGRYMIQLWFYQEQGDDVLKGELPFLVVTEGESP